MNLQEIYEQVSFCLGSEDVCVKCPYHKAGSCEDIFDLLGKVVNVIEEVLQNGMANN